MSLIDVVLRYEILYVALRDFGPKWMKTRHPNGSVPVLEKDGKILYESLVLVQFVDDLNEDSKLTLTDPYRKACQGMLIAAWSSVSSLTSIQKRI